MALIIFGREENCDIGGGYLMWLWLREKWAWWVGALGTLIIICYGVLPLFRPSASDALMRLTAAYSLFCRSFRVGGG